MSYNRNILLAIIRTILVIVISITIFIFCFIYCLCKPRNPNNVALVGRCFGMMANIFGIRVEVRYPIKTTMPKKCIYIANHQNNFDLVTVASVVQQRTVTVGKKSLLWIPLFGQLYWLSGNLLIDRDNSTSVYLKKMIHHIKKNNISLLIFPEGTRSRGRGLLQFKTGAFYTAIAADVPIVPICVSNTTNKIQLSRWSNGLVIIEILSPVVTKGYDIAQFRELTKYCHEIMKKKLDTMNAEVDNPSSNSLRLR